MKNFHLITLLCFAIFSMNGKAQNNDSLVSVLDETIVKREQYTQQKHQRLKTLERQMQKTRLSGTKEDIYQAYIKLYDGYNEFKYDSAYFYIEKAKGVAKEIKPTTHLSEAKIKEGFLLLSAGLFTEAIDTLQSIDTLALTPLKKYDLYFTKARSYFDLAEYNDDSKFQINYIRKGILNLNKSGKILHFF